MILKKIGNNPDYDPQRPPYTANFFFPKASVRNSSNTCAIGKILSNRMAGRTVITPQMSNEIVSDEVREQYSPPEPVIVSNRLNIPEPVLGPSKQHLTQEKFENQIVNTTYPIVSPLSFEPVNDPRTTATFVFIVGTAVALMIWSIEGGGGFAMCFWHLVVLPIGCTYTYSYKKMKQEWEKEHGIYNASEERKKMIESTIISLLLVCVFTLLIVYAMPILFVMVLM